MDLTYDLFIQIAYALGVGLLIGLERSFEHLTAGDDVTDGASKAKQTAKRPEIALESDRDPPSMIDFLGLRTFAVLSLSGYIVGLAGERHPFLAPLGLAGITLLIVAMYYRTGYIGFGITTEVAAIATFALGILCRYYPEAAGVLALVVTVILASKRFTHETISRMRRVELTDTLKFLVIIVIVLPLLPNRPLDPYKAFNPYKVGFLVVLISGISFVGYFLTRILGARRGLGLTGILGGLTSSTAVTAAMSAQARRNPALIHICGFSTVAANATMFLRVLVVVAVLDTGLLMRLAWSVGGMALTAALAAVFLWFLAGKETRNGGRDNAGDVKLANPFSLGPALKFAVFFVFILFFVRFAQSYSGESGLYAAAGLSGLADVDAITLSISEQAAAGSLIRRAGAIAITIAVVSNSAVKTGIAFYSGGLHFGRLIAICLGAATMVGLTVAIIV